MKSLRPTRPTVPVLAKLKIVTGRIWTYVRDDRPFGGKDPPAAMFYYSRNRAGDHFREHLAGYAGITQADARSGVHRPWPQPTPLPSIGRSVHEEPRSRPLCFQLGHAHMVVRATPTAGRSLMPSIRDATKRSFPHSVLYLQPSATHSRLLLKRWHHETSNRWLRMFSQVGAPAVGFVLGLVVTYGFADAGPGPVSSRILLDALLQTSVNSEIRVGDEGVASFDERFADGKVKKGSLASYPHFASLEMGPGAGVLVGRASVFTRSGAMLPAGQSDSFAERFAGTKAASLAPVAPAPKSSWVVQLIGDDTEATALQRFRQMQTKHRAILGIYEPIVVNTTLKPGAPPIWTRVRVGLNSREAADSLCAQLESAGERCVVQRNMNALTPATGEMAIDPA